MSNAQELHYRVMDITHNIMADPMYQSDNLRLDVMYMPLFPLIYRKVKETVLANPAMSNEDVHRKVIADEEVKRAVEESNKPIKFYNNSENESFGGRKPKKTSKKRRGAAAKKTRKGRSKRSRRF